MQAPQHPGLQQQEQPQGLSPQPTNGNQYFTPNARLQEAQSEKMKQEQAYQMGQAQQAAEIQHVNAQASKTQAEANLLRQAGQGLGGAIQEQQQVDPRQEQAAQVAQAIMGGELGQEQLQALVQGGKLSPDVAAAAVSMVQQASQAQQAPGLGAIE